MKRIIFSVVFIFSAFVFSISAQSFHIRQNFEGAMLSAKSREFETALTQFQTTLSLAKKEHANQNFIAKLHFNIGVCLYQIKQQAAAVSEFELAILLTPDYEKAFYALGMAQFELKNLRESERAFLSAINLNGRNGETWFDLAFVYLVQQNYESARNAFENSVKFKSVSSAIGRNNLGVIFALRGDFPSAIAQFEKAINESNGQLIVSRQNLQFCKTSKQNSGKDLIAKLEFSK
jgi:tetratricopeptide (TPR) repeat protein